MVSIIMPCFNAGKYILEAIESVVNQTYSDWELIIINDGSTDCSQQVVENYIQSPITNHQSQIRLINQPNSGACVARNRGIQESKGEFIKFLDADDMLMPTCLEEQVKQMQTLKPNQIPFGDYGNVDESGNLISKFHFSESLLNSLANNSVLFFYWCWYILISSPLHRVDLLRVISGFDTALKRGQESDMHFRLALADVEFVYFPSYTFVYRDYDSSSRISSNFKEGSRKLKEIRFQRDERYERLLLQKYGILPMCYHGWFAIHHFNKARLEFAQGNEHQGLNDLEQAKQYGMHSSFSRWYMMMGRLFGYCFIEKILCYRMRHLGKL